MKVDVVGATVRLKLWSTDIVAEPVAGMLWLPLPRHHQVLVP